MRVLDAGCGDGRNLTYLLRSAFDVFGVDRSTEAVRRVRGAAATLAPHPHPERFIVGAVEHLAFAPDSFDVVVSSAVLHFSDDEDHFNRMVSEMWRVLRPEGFFFARLASTIGIESRLQPLGGRRFHLPDGTDRFLVDAVLLEHVSRRLRARWAEPLKTVIVQDQRAMSTWCLEKP